MDVVVGDLLKGPKSNEPAERINWLRQAHFACASASEASVVRIAKPLKEAIDLVAAAEKKGKELDDAGEAQLAGLLIQVQGLALLGYLEDLNKLRNAIAKQGAALKPGTAERKDVEKLQGAYEQVIDGLARAYNGLREGKLEELKQVGPMMEQARKIADSLRK